MKEFIPHKYQEPIIKLMRDNNQFAVFAFPGSGKTVMSLDKIYELKITTLVVAPIDVIYTTWINENRKWTFSKNLKSTVLHGPNKDRRFTLKRGVYYINPEGLKWLIAKIQKTKRFPWKMLIVDESIKFKNHKAVQFKKLISLISHFEYTYILSGNPMPTHYLDLWAQIYILDEGKRLGKSLYAFRQKYFYPTDYMRYNWELKPGAKEEIIRKINDIACFLDVDKELELPERIIVDKEIILPQDVMKQYKQMEVKLFAEMDEGKVLANNKTSSHMKCWQMANGFLYESEEREHPTTGEIQMVRIKTHYVHNELINITKGIVEDLQGSPILIGYQFKEDLVRLKAAFPKATVVESGCKPAVIRKAEKDWNNDEIEILLVHVNKFSHGLNLQYGSGCHILFYGLTYNYDVYDQLIRRFERQGAKFKNVIIFRLIVKNTIHEVIIDNLENKGITSLDFLHSLKKYRQEQENGR